MRTYQGDAILGVSLTVQTPKPIDSRMVVDTEKDLYTITDYLYNGMMVVCKDTGCIYTLKDKLYSNSKNGWVKSIDNSLIVTITKELYKTLENSSLINPDIYYYIKEEEDELGYYVTGSAFKEAIDTLTNRLNEKVGKTDVESFIGEDFVKDLVKDFVTKEELENKKYLTSEDLGGVTKFASAEDLNKAKEDINLNKESIDTVKSQVDNIHTIENLTYSDGVLKIDDLPIATLKYVSENTTKGDIPKLVTKSLSEYLREEKDPDTYYFIPDKASEEKPALDEYEVAELIGQLQKKIQELSSKIDSINTGTSSNVSVSNGVLTYGFAN